ncbi:hypothetical protein L332_05935 [Agrococcus pavilionensis RW1]|uniref:Oxidoreductase/dehydrogenase Rossmann-like domain-containing protein n=1 Tax=Agrococcus pavilionensis RW1 TaxID=1330458 RepID=U1MPY9_9MICO|nr:DUF2520 domain-containing protein [Agrococcus pavilionensis]ERG63996.1 hypothetical protein L332_05935 [Agrococcus pavilionensis RW1]
MSAADAVRRPGRLGVGIVGAGSVGPVLGAALAGAGHAIVGIVATGADAIDRAEALLPGVPMLDTPTLVERSELVLLAVPSTELPGLVAGLAATGAWQPGQLVVHTAAEHGVEVLLPARERGAIPIALHPAMAFTGTSLDLGRLLESTIAVTAPGPVLPIGQALAVEMGAESIVVDEADRPAYAEAIGAARDFAEGIVAQALRQLHELGVERPARVLGGVVRSAVETALARYPDPPLEP